MFRAGNYTTSGDVTLQWVQGYTGATTHHLFDFDDANGCPQVWPNDHTCHAHDKVTADWTYDNVLAITWPAGSNVSPKLFPLPQIYYQVNAVEWTFMSRYSATLTRGKINFRGPTTEYHRDSSTNTPLNGWTDLYSELNSFSATSQSVNYATDFTLGF